MNERIRELAKQLDDGTFIDGMGFGEGNIEGLAELILEECLNIVGHYTDVDEGIAVAKKNFGVE